MQKAPQRVAQPEALRPQLRDPRQLRRCPRGSDVHTAPVNAPQVTAQKLNVNFGSDSCPPATSSPGALPGPVTCRLHGRAPAARTPLRAAARARVQRPERPGGTRVLPGHPPANAAAPPPPPPPPAQRGPSGRARSPRGPREWVAGGRADGVAGLEPGVPVGPAGSQVAGAPSRGTFPRLTCARPFLSRWEPSSPSRQHRADTPAAAATAARGELEHRPPDSAAQSATLRTEHAHTQAPGPGRAVTPAINRSRQPRPSAPRARPAPSRWPRPHAQQPARPRPGPSSWVGPAGRYSRGGSLGREIPREPRPGWSILRRRAPAPPWVWPRGQVAAGRAGGAGGGGARPLVQVALPVPAGRVLSPGGESPRGASGRGVARSCVSPGPRPPCRSALPCSCRGAGRVQVCMPGGGSRLSECRLSHTC